VATNHSDFNFNFKKTEGVMDMKHINSDLSPIEKGEAK